MENVHEVRTALRAAGHERGDRAGAPARVALAAARRAGPTSSSTSARAIDGMARYEDCVVGALELTGVPFIGLPLLGHHGLPPEAPWPTRCSQLGGVPIPTFTLAQGNQVPADFPLPAIVKPNGEDASVGIDGEAVCTTRRRALRKRVAAMLEQFERGAGAGVRAGREFNVGFVGEPDAAHLGDQLRPDARGQLADRDLRGQVGAGEPGGRWARSRSARRASPPISRSASARWPGARGTYLAGSEGYGRVDLRVDDAGQAVGARGESVPRHQSSDAGLARMARAAGWNYDEMLLRIVDEALGRAQRAAAAAATAAQVPVPGVRGAPHRAGHGTRAAQATHAGRPRPPRDDHPRHGPLSATTRSRSPSRCSTPRWPAATTTPRSAPTPASALAGWICWGPTPCTLGTCDLYWIVVDPAQHSAGIGSLLLAEMEQQLAGVARLIVVETAGRDGVRAHAGVLRAARVHRRGPHPGLLRPGRRSGRLHQGITAVARP